MPISSVQGPLQGALYKWTNLINGWQFRWFVLDQQNGILSYFTSKENMVKGERRGCIRLRDAFVGYDNEDDITFTITVDDKTFHLQSKNLDEREKWVSRIERTIRLHSSKGASFDVTTKSDNDLNKSFNSNLTSSLNSNDQFNSLINTSQIRNNDIKDLTSEAENLVNNSKNNNGESSNEEYFNSIASSSNTSLLNKSDFIQFDSCLTESDAYLQLLIEQLKGLELKKLSLLNEKCVNLNVASESNETSKISTETSNESTNVNSSDKEQDAKAIDSVINATESLIETLKHAIICLQIAKANSDPLNVIASTQNLEEVLSHFNDTIPVKKSENDSKEAFHNASVDKQKTQTPKEVDTQNNLIATSTQLHEQISIQDNQNPRRIIPMSSYSSSDEENVDETMKITSAKAKKNRDRDDDVDDDDDEDFYDDERNIYETQYNSNSKNINDDDDDDDDFDRNNNDDNDSENFYDAIDSNQSVTPNDSQSKQMTSLVLNSNSTNFTNDLANNEMKSVKISEKNLNKPDSTSLTTAKISSLTSHTSSPLQINSTSHLPLQNRNQLCQFDLDYDEDIPQEDVELDNQQSVITHLLTQVRIGMDLTKITLPTFILEPRSLLEMYADFFAHTDLFLEIPDTKHPRDRMVKVVKWYLSTFHAGRKSPVAKKPYNPILGELFQCWYSIPGVSSEDKALVSDGPVPWATRDQLTFISEQVSHHPPISAFYAEHFNKRVQLDGYTWTKSKFLGLSIGVHMIGKAVLSLLDFSEEYIFSFPSAYGRSILTVPWFEMGGQVTILCPKSGYNTTIDFLTKPFYGGKKHQISGTICGPDKKQLYTLDGDWNGTMFIKSGKSQDILISTQSTPTIKKQVRPVQEQTEFESRRLWQEVTYYLRNKKIDQATMAKQRLEQMQRDDAKFRKETNQKWKTKYFHEQGEHWIYVKPLVNRLAASMQNNN